MKLNVYCQSHVYAIEVDVEPPAPAANVENHVNQASKESDHGDTEAADAAAATAAAAGATAASTAVDTASTASSTVAIATTGDVKKISTFGALKEELCRLCEFTPETTMKIIHRGRTLAAEDSAPLSSFNFHENDKLMVLGRPPSTQTDAGWKQLLEFERKHIDKIQQTYNLNNVDLTELEKNFTNGKIRESMINGMDKRLKGFTEACMKHLETLDGLQIVTDATEERQAQLNRDKRKYLVNGLQDALNKNDKLVNRLNDYRYKCEHPEEDL